MKYYIFYLYTLLKFLELNMLYLSYLNNKYVRFDTSYDPNIEEVIKNNSWLTELRNLVQKTHISDLGQIDNFGIVNRNGKPMIVILDTGFNFDVLLKHYTK